MRRGVLSFQLVAPLLFLGVGVLLWYTAGPALAWMGETFATPLWVIRNWSALTTETQTVILLLVAGASFGVWSIYRSAHLFVWRAWFPDLARVDEHGNRTRYGRAFGWRQAEDGSWLVRWRWNGRRSAPWKFHTLVSPTRPERVGAFMVVVPAARFERVAGREWVAVPAGSPERDLPTTRLNIIEFRTWEVNDLERKKTLARDGAQGHLFTQRARLMNNRGDTTMLRPFILQRTRATARLVDFKRRTLTPEERIALTIREGPYGEDGELAAPSSLEDDSRRNGGGPE